MILVPVKILTTAKQRLASLLDQRARVELAHAMLHDVADVLAGWQGRPEVAFVTSDSFALELADTFDFRVIPDDSNLGETAAIEMATRFCESHHIDTTVVIPGDIPLLQANELQLVLEAAPETGTVLVPASDGRGTNAALRRPAGLFPLRFGNDSFKPHLAAAHATGLPVEVLTLPGIGLDVDNPSDLRDLAAAPGCCRSQLLARRWSLTDLPLAANE